MDENKKRALTAALAQIDKQFGKGTVMLMGDKNVEAHEVIGEQLAGIARPDEPASNGGEPVGLPAEPTAPTLGG